MYVSFKSQTAQYSTRAKASPIARFNLAHDIGAPGPSPAKASTVKPSAVLG